MSQRDRLPRWHPLGLSDRWRLLDLSARWRLPGLLNLLRRWGQWHLLHLLRLWGLLRHLLRQSPHWRWRLSLRILVRFLFQFHSAT